MQATRNIKFEDVGRRFAFTWQSPTTISGRLQNWLDLDGTVSGLGEPTLIGSGFSDAGLWWKVDNDVVHDEQGPLQFIKINNGPTRGLGHIRLAWDDDLHARVGRTECTNNYPYKACPPVGRIRHYGPMFDSSADKLGGLSVHANPDIVGPVGGFGWLLRLNNGAPRKLKINTIEVHPDTPLTLGIAYPFGTAFKITAHAAYCDVSQSYTCQEIFSSVTSAAQVRSSDGNTYHFNAKTGLLTIRIVQTPRGFTGNPGWKLWDFNMPGKWDDGYALGRFERDGVLLPMPTFGAYLELEANCGGTGPYCSGFTPSPEPIVCNSGYQQVAYDKCCLTNDMSVCVYA